MKEAIAQQSIVTDSTAFEPSIHCLDLSEGLRNWLQGLAHIYDSGMPNLCVTSTHFSITNSIVHIKAISFFLLARGRHGDANHERQLCSSEYMQARLVSKLNTFTSGSYELAMLALCRLIEAEDVRNEVDRRSVSYGSRCSRSKCDSRGFLKSLELHDQNHWFPPSVAFAGHLELDSPVRL